MSEEQKKFSFLESLKRTILNTDKEEPKNPSDDEAMPKPAPRAMSVKSVQPPSDEEDNFKFKGISNAKEIDVKFAENFADSGGKFIFVEDIPQLFVFLNSIKKDNKWNNIYSVDKSFTRLMKENNFQTENFDILLDHSDAAISFCYSLSADEGVIILSPEEATNRRLVTFPKNHIIVAFKDQLKPNIEKAIWGFRETYEDRLPSVLELYPEKPVARSNHKTLLSAEGPKNVYLFYIDSEIE